MGRRSQWAPVMLFGSRKHRFILVLSLARLLCTISLHTLAIYAKNLPTMSSQALGPSTMGR